MDQFRFNVINISRNACDISVRIAVVNTLTLGKVKLSYPNFIVNDRHWISLAHGMAI